MNEGRLDLYFWTILVLLFLGFVAFYFTAARFRYRADLPHAAVSTEALALTPDTRSGLSASTSMRRRVKRQLAGGSVLRLGTLAQELAEGQLSARSSRALRLEASRLSSSALPAEGAEGSGPIALAGSKV